MTTSITISGLERREQLLHFVETHQRATIAEICDEFLVSPATVRRDLETLEQEGKLRRFHGGALAIKSAPPEPPFVERSGAQAEEKRRIGRAAAALVQDGETILLGSGTTVLEVARNLRQHQDLTVVTNSLLVMNMLADVPSVTLVGLGGILRPTEKSLIGHLTELTLNELRVQKVIMGIRAVDLDAGITNDYLPETQTDRKILGISRELILVADHTKCGRTSSVFLAPLDVVHTFVTDTETPVEFTSALRDLGVQVITA
ncbi:MAG: DeoR/GlpR family DNA-binding transcription regulator [Anaerolineae bacterium]